MADARSRARVAHVIAPADFGGAESVVRALAEGRHASSGSTMVVLLLQHDRPAPLAEALSRSGVPVVELRCGRRRYGREMRALEKTLRDWGATLVHSHVYHADFVSLRAARRCGIPVVSTVHGFAGGSAKNRFFEWFDRRLLGRFDRVVCVAEAQRSLLRRSGIPTNRIRVVRNGISPPALMDRIAARHALRLPAEGPIVGWLGRLSAEKGPDQFVRVVRALEHADVVGAMIGDGPERAETEALIAATGVNIRLLGPVADAARSLRAFDVIALTSRTEGTPIVLLEAMSAGIPIVSFGVGGVPAVVDETVSWLVPPGDVDGMARALRHALDDSAEAGRRSLAASERLARDCGLGPWLAALETVYEEARAPM